MANIGGPKGNDPTKVVGGAKILPFREAKPVETVENKQEKLEPPKVDVLDAPSSAGGSRDKVLDPHADVVRGAGVKARLAALGVKGSEGLIKTAAKDAARVKDTPLGKILEGSVTVESPEGLRKLEGVVRIAGDLVIQESAAKSVDFVHLKSLAEIGGRLIIEGNGSVGVLDGLENLERAKGIYIGFNSSLMRLSLPKLKELEAALIVEGNPNLTEMSLPAFHKGGMYLHVHDNAALAVLSLPSLGKLGEELSLRDNPKLSKVVVGTALKPAQVESVELEHNASSSFAQIHVRT